MTNKEYFTREEFVNMVEAYNKAEKERQELKVENERLKEEFKRLKESECIICKYSNIGDKYHQTLQEIKAIAESYVRGCVDCSLIAEPYECEDCTDGGMAKLGKKILDLITKAEEE